MSELFNKKAMPKQQQTDFSVFVKEYFSDLYEVISFNHISKFKAEMSEVHDLSLTVNKLEEYH